MTFVPKKKSDSMSTSTTDNNASTHANHSSSTTNTNTKTTSASNNPLVVKESNQSDEQHFTDHDQQQQHQHRRSPQVQCGSSDRMSQEDMSYSSYNGDDQNHDRRHNHHHHHHHHHNNSHHHNKYSSTKGDNDANVNHVILITVINPHYPITCDLIHQICSNHGKVNRIVIFKKNGVQAMVEFDNIESAKKARSTLHGCDIYSGCCTLKIEFAKPSRLNVHRNDSESFDYTNPNLGSGPSAAQANSDSGQDDDQNQSDHHHHHQQPHHHHHHQQQTSASGPHGSYQHGMNPHHSQGPSGMGGRRGLAVGGSGSDTGSGAHNTSSGHNHHHQHGNQFHPPQHMHQSLNSHHQHSKQSLQASIGSQQHPQHGSMHQPVGYTINQGVDESGVNTSDSTDSTFHQHTQGDSSGFGMPRDGHSGNANAMVSNQQNFSGSMDTFVSTPTTQQSGTHLNPHTVPGGMYQQRQDGGGHQHHSQPHHSGQARGRPGGSGQGRGRNHHNSSFPPINSIGALMNASSSHQGTVLMVYGLCVDRINCDRLFNLFCLYGNVVRIKFLRTKEGCAMVQMGDVLAVDRCFNSLNKTVLFGNELQISYSKQAFLHDVMQPFTLPDGSPSFKDFMGNKNNRFRNPEVASKNRILPPSRVLHFFNAPYGISEDELIVLFKQNTNHEPVSLKIFPPKVDNAKSFSGLVTFRDPAEATEALVLCNHLSIPKAGVPHPYILRLCFSPPTYC